MYYDADNNCVLIVITQLFWCVLTESLHYGPSMEMKILQSPSSPLPKSIIGSLNTTFMGHTLELLEVCKWRSYHSFSLKFQCLIYIIIWWIVFLARQLLLTPILVFHQVGIDTEGMDTLLHRLVGPYGILKDIISQHASISDILKPGSSPLWGRVHSELADIVDKVTWLVP